MLQKRNTIHTMEEKAREKEEIRLALAKAYFESKIENTDDFFASLLLSSSSSPSDSSSLKSNKNEILNLWRSALQEENESGEKEKVDDDAMIRTALREVLEAKFNNKNEDAPGKKRQKKIFDEGEQKQREEQKQRFCFLEQFVREREENVQKLKRDVLEEEISLLKWREQRVREKKKHVEKRRRVEESSGLPYVPELTKPTKAECERFVREVEEGLEKKEYAPQFREVLERVRKTMETKNGGSAMVETAAAEYAMLHLGGAKYRAKKFALPRAEEEEEEKTGEGEEEEEEEAKRRGLQCEREFQLELEKSRRVNGTGEKKIGANANVVTHERWEGRMNSTSKSDALNHGSDVEYLMYRDVIPNMNKVDGVDWEKCGRLGERVVFNVLIQKYRGTNVSVKWMNEIEESNSFYDIMLTDGDSHAKTFIEVKATRFRDKNAFEISPWEWDFAVKPEVADRYQIWRVFGIGDGKDVSIVVIHNPARLVREKKIGQALII